MRPDALVGLDHACIEQFRQHDVPFEQARPVLIGDAQCVAKSAGDDQHRRLALALEQRVGRHRRTHFHGGDPLDRDGCIGGHAEQAADTGHRSVAVLLRVFRQ